ncbi:nodulation protein NfeD [Caldibacillus lycopersici]|uniref:Nodulation protein NfeD n=1 Tax=Perspicuibacillus lycopersici TaxID=1325689 RepID=A0AAE3IUQ6_9BACI|nr:NfeD family protein [Perspicuibacillus lycopersici]MCU9613923.1 nodulation protein NfeD [Perspicuibacillus lycopersici]
MIKRWIKIMLLALVVSLSFFPIEKASGNNDIVYFADINSEVTKGLYEYIGRAISVAEEEGASAIVFEIDTPGGAVDAAGDISKLLSETDLKTIAFINPDAISAGSYIALSMDEIYMVPSGRMGAAAVITQDGNAADKKAQSYWLAAMKTAAEKNNRDPIYAMAMADESIDLPEVGSPKGKLLTLTASQAVEVGYAEGIVQNQADLLQKLGYADAEVRHVEKAWSEKIAEFLTNSYIVPILLSLGSLGLIVELYSPGFGIPGFMGISSLLLFFYGHFIAGLAGFESIILFTLGIILIVVELFLPGGILGFLGLGSIILSILLAGENMVQMGINLLIAIAIAVIAMVILMKVFKKKIRVFNKIILKDSTNTEQGYISNKTRTDLLNKTGISLTPLRPAGTIMIDGERVDAVTEGSFVNSGVKVSVVKVEGVRVVVREV